MQPRVHTTIWEVYIVCSICIQYVYTAYSVRQAYAVCIYSICTQYAGVAHKMWVSWKVCICGVYTCTYCMLADLQETLQIGRRRGAEWAYFSDISMVEEQPYKLVNVRYHDPQTDGCKDNGTKVKMLGEDQGFELALSTSTQPSNEAGKW